MTEPLSGEQYETEAEWEARENGTTKGEPMTEEIYLARRALLDDAPFPAETPGLLLDELWDLSESYRRLRSELEEAETALDESATHCECCTAACETLRLREENERLRAEQQTDRGAWQESCVEQDTALSSLLEIAEVACARASPNSIVRERLAAWQEANP